jgi:acyl-homoserine-lactone acylase
MGGHPLMQEHIKALDAILHCAPRRKITRSYRQTMELKANSSNNTIFADADGDIAYFHGNFIPRRDTSFDLDQAGGWQQSRHGMAGAV